MALGAQAWPWAQAGEGGACVDVLVMGQSAALMAHAVALPVYECTHACCWAAGPACVFDTSNRICQAGAGRHSSPMDAHCRAPDCVFQTAEHMSTRLLHLCCWLRRGLGSAGESFPSLPALRVLPAGLMGTPSFTLSSGQQSPAAATTSFCATPSMWSRTCLWTSAHQAPQGTAMQMRTACSRTSNPQQMQSSVPAFGALQCRHERLTLGEPATFCVKTSTQLQNGSIWQ